VKSIFVKPRVAKLDSNPASFSSLLNVRLPKPISDTIPERIFIEISLQSAACEPKPSPQSTRELSLSGNQS
jgi:hypothetical protein